MRAPSRTWSAVATADGCGLGQADQVGVEEGFGGLAGAGHVQPEVGTDRPDPEALPVDGQDQVALTAAEVGRGHVAVVRDEREGVVLLEEVLAT